MSFFNGHPNQGSIFPQTAAPFGIASPLGVPAPPMGALQTAPGYPYGYPAYHYPTYGAQQVHPAYYQGGAYSQGPVYGAAGYQGYGVGTPGYTGPHYTHPVAQGVQSDQYGLPVVQGDMVLQYAQTFRVDEKVASITRDSFFVRDTSGRFIYKVEGSFTIHEMKTLRDINGHTLLLLREARLRIRDRITILSPTNVPLLTLQKTSPIQIGTKRVHGFIGAYPKTTPDVVITGNHNSTHFKILNAQEQEVGVVRRRKYAAKNILTGQDTYEVTVRGGSPALICFIAVALDEIYED